MLYDGRVTGKTGDLTDMTGCIADDGSGDLVDLNIAQINADFVDAVDAAHKYGIVVIIVAALSVGRFLTTIRTGDLEEPSQVAKIVNNLWSIGGVVQFVFTIMFLVACESEQSSPARRILYRRARTAC